MKIEIDLNDILGDENGAETLQESVRRQVIDTLVSRTRDGMNKTIDEAVSQTITATLQAELVSRMPEILNDVLTSEYTPISNYGARGDPTSFRAELIKGINLQMVYKPSAYSSEKTAFTKAVDDVVAANMGEFKKQFDTLVTKQFVADAMKYATDEMAKRLGLAK